MKKFSFMKAIIAVLIIVTFLTGCTAKDTETKNADAVDKKNSSSDSEKTIVKDVKGDVEIPAAPKRIVDLSGNSDILSILGYKVVGTANSDAYDYTKFPSYLEDTLKGAQIVGFSMQDTIDIEAIMNLSPDLIIISTVQEKMYDQLKEIAPTVMVHLEALDWKEDVKAFSKIFHKEDVADKWITDYEKKSKEAGDQIKNHLGKDTTYLAFLASGGQFFVFDGAGFGSLLYQDMGLAKPQGMPEQSDISLPVVTYEGLAAIEADYIFVLGTNDDMEALNKSTIWNNLTAVKEKHVVQLPASPYFVQGYSSIGRNLLINETVEMLNGQKK